MEPKSKLNSWLEDELSKSFAKEIQEVIDNGIIIDLIMQTGEYNYKHQFTVDPDTMIQWCVENFLSNWKIFGNHIFIESEKDNNWYLLRWT